MHNFGVPGQRFPTEFWGGLELSQGSEVSELLGTAGFQPFRVPRVAVGSRKMLQGSDVPSFGAAGIDFPSTQRQLWLYDVVCICMHSMHS